MMTHTTPKTSAVPFLQQAIWRRIALPASAITVADILRVISMSQQVIKLRMTNITAEDLIVEVLSVSPADALRQEAVFHCFLADQLLRRRIDEQSSEQISQIVNATLIRSSSC